MEPNGQRRTPTGIWILLGLVGASAVLIGVALFGPELPGPNVTELFEDEPQVVLQPCDPDPRAVVEPRQRVSGGGRWKREPDLPVAYDELRAVAVDDRIWIMNGQDVSEEGEQISVADMFAFDPTRGTYTEAPETPVPLDHSAVVAYEGDLYLVGGDTNGEPTSGLWRYSPESSQWDSLASMSVPRAGHAAAVIGDRLYVVGGSTGGSTFDDDEIEALRSLEIYDFGTGEWSDGPEMPTGRHHFDATAADGKLYAIGGRAPGDFALDAVERFDPASGEWESLPPLPLGTGGASALTAGGRVLVIAGGDDIEGWVTPAVWSLDPMGEGWERLPDVRVPRHGHAAASLGERAYIFGGAPCALYGRTTSVESLAVEAS